MQFLYRALDRLRFRLRGRNGNLVHARGAFGEDLAHRYLLDHGFIVVSRNFQTKSGSGEVDLICWDGPALVFVEVKARATDGFGEPELAVDEDKRIRIRRGAAEYLRRTGLSWDLVRFDLVSVLIGETQSVRHIKDAFGSGTHHGDRSSGGTVDVSAPPGFAA